MKVNPQQLAAVTALPASQRYEYFIKVVANWHEVWGLCRDDWVLASTADGARSVFPLWPAKEYAEICANNAWAGYTPRALHLDELMDELLPRLKQDDILPGIFFTPSDHGVTPTVDQLKDALETHMRNWYGWEPDELE